MNYHGRIVERNEGRMGLWRNVSWSVLSESVILDMVTAFTRLHKSSSHGIPIIWKVPPLLPNRPRSYLPPVPIPRMAANRSILTMRWKPVIISLRSVGFSTMLMSRWTGIWSVSPACHSQAGHQTGLRLAFQRGRLQDSAELYWQSCHSDKDCAAAGCSRIYGQAV